ncbi:hypothetical protein Tco_0367645, partial [Tanacetum coccineum]
CLILGFPSISATLVVVGVGPLSGKGPRIIVFADASVLPRLSSATGVTKPKPKSLNNASFAAKKATHKSKSGPALEPGHGKLQKNVKKPVKQEPNKGKQTVKTGAITPADEKAQLDTVPKEAMPEENKENMVNIYVDLDIYFVTGCSPGGRDERGS